MFFNNNPMMPNAYPQTGYGFAQQPKPRYTQPLTPEIIAKLRSNGANFKIEVTQEDLWRASCTHKDNGVATLVTEGINPETGNDIVRCTICGEVFEMCNYDKKDIEKHVNELINMLQTSKTVYLDAPESLITQYYQTIPLLKKFPDLWERAQQNFAVYSNAFNNATPGSVGSGFDGFQMMNNMLQNPYGYGGYGYGQPMMPQQPMMNPNMYQAPMGQPVAPQQQMPMYQAPMGQPMMNNPFAYQGVPQQQAAAPMMNVPPVAPAAPQAAPAESGEVTQQKTFNV